MIYFDCFQGAAADMLCGALVDSCTCKTLQEKINAFEGTEIVFSAEETRFNAISGMKVSFKVQGKKPPADLKGIKTFIENSSLGVNIKKKIIDTYMEIFKAEAVVHGRSPDKVKLHELSVPEKIAEITAYHILSENEELFFSNPVLGKGSVKSAHGKIPVPSPATAEILKGGPVSFSDEEKEMFTPSSAALLKVSASPGHPDMVINKIGYGIGKRSVLRVFRGDRIESSSRGDVTEIEFNVDDMTPEDISFFTEKISVFALDFWITPIIMKKSRSGHKITVLSEGKNLKKIHDLIFDHSSTAGLRLKQVNRSVVERQSTEINTSLGRCRIKKYLLPSGKTRFKPEYEDIKKLAEKNRISLAQAREKVRKEYKP